MTYSNNKDKSLKNKNKNTPDINPMLYGKVPPQAVEIEEVVLGAIMLEKDAIDVVSSTLPMDAFYSESNRLIYKAIISLHKKSHAIDILTVIEEMKREGDLEKIESGSYYITRLTNNVTSSANIENHSRIILEKYLLREQIRICGEALTDAYEPGADAFDCLDLINSRLTDLSIQKSGRTVTTIDTLLVNSVKRIEELRRNKEEITGVPSGFLDIDRVTFGWQATDLIIIAARPSVGKTAFALNLARNAALNHIKPAPVAVFSLEMSSSQLVNRILSAESEIWLDKINRGKLEEVDMKKLYVNGIQRLAGAPIYIDDTPAMNLFELRAKCRRLKVANNIGLIIIDYLQLMSGAGENRSNNRQEIISEISRGLKSLAKELCVPIIALSQLSREIEKRTDPRPQLSDLRESGAIEQDADMVIFGWREDYGKTDEEKDPALSGVVTWRIAKHRNGSLEEIPMRCDLAIQKFFTVEKFEAYQSGRGNLISMQQAMNNSSMLYLKTKTPTGTEDGDYF